MTKIKPLQPFLPVATLVDVLDFDPNDPSTHTPSPLINAVAKVLHTTHFLEAGEVAAYMDLDRRKLSAALQIELDMGLQELIRDFRLQRIRQYISQHPNATLAEVATNNGYASDSSIWRLFFRRLGTTPNGEKSAGKKMEWRAEMELLNRRSLNASASEE